MIATLDACVLYPTVLRQILLGCAARGVFTPIWSERLLEEWHRAALRRGGAPEGAEALSEIIRARARFPDATHPDAAPDPALWLPDLADVHVLQTAIASGSEQIVTLNLRDFPARELSTHGLVATSPDAFLMGLWLDHPQAVQEVVEAVHHTACALAKEAFALRALLKRARLPRLGKALSQG